MYILILVGIFTGLVSVLLVARPEIGFEFGKKHFLSAKFQYGIGVFSLLLAPAIYYAAAESKFPEIFEFVALFSLIGGIIVIILPQENFKSVVSWELEAFLPHARLLGLMYALGGSFIIYAAI